MYLFLFFHSYKNFKIKIFFLKIFCDVEINRILNFNNIDNKTNNNLFERS